MVKIFVLILSFCFSLSFTQNTENHLRFYVSADVKGETEPCG